MFDKRGGKQDAIMVLYVDGFDPLDNAFQPAQRLLRRGSLQEQRKLLRSSLYLKASRLTHEVAHLDIVVADDDVGHVILAGRRL